MDFTLSPEHELLRKTAADFFAAADRDDAGRAQVPWAALSDLGWLDTDLDPVALAVLCEESGAALLAQPWLVTMAAAAPVYYAAGLPITAAVAVAGLSAGAARYAAGPVLHGRCGPLPWHGGDGDLVVLADGVSSPGLLRVRGNAGPAAVTTLPGFDDSRPMAEVSLAGDPAERLLDAPGELVATLRRRLRTLAACEAVGVARRALAVAVAHAKARRQFGKPIGTFQAVSHRLAESFAEVQLASALAYRAAAALDSDEPALTAELAATTAAITATEAAIQTLGATACLHDSHAAALYRRARSGSLLGTTRSATRNQLATALLDAPHDLQ